MKERENSHLQTKYFYMGNVEHKSEKTRINRTLSDTPTVHRSLAGLLGKSILWVETYFLSLASD